MLSMSTLQYSVLSYSAGLAMGFSFISLFLVFVPLYFFFHLYNVLIFDCKCVTDADMEDYGFEYSEEEPDEQDVDIENEYYNSKGTVIHLIAVFCYYYFFFFFFCRELFHGYSGFICDLRALYLGGLI